MSIRLSYIPITTQALTQVLRQLDATAQLDVDEAALARARTQGVFDLGRLLVNDRLAKRDVVATVDESDEARLRDRLGGPR